MQAFDKAFLDEIQTNGNILNVWVNLLQEACAESGNAQLCTVLIRVPNYSFVYFEARVGKSDAKRCATR